MLKSSPFSIVGTKKNTSLFTWNLNKPNYLKKFQANKDTNFKQGYRVTVK